MLIFGAGDAGEMVLREIGRNKALNYNPIGFIDDDPIKLGTKIHGVPVLGSRDNIRNIAAREDVKEMIIAVPSVEDKIIDEIASICSQAGISCRIMKSILTE